MTQTNKMIEIERRFFERYVGECEAIYHRETKEPVCVYEILNFIREECDRLSSLKDAECAEKCEKVRREQIRKDVGIVDGACWKNGLLASIVLFEQLNQK